MDTAPDRAQTARPAPARGVRINGVFVPLNEKNSDTVLGYIIENVPKASARFSYDKPSGKLTFTIKCFGQTVSVDAVSNFKGEKDDELRVMALNKLDEIIHFLISEEQASAIGKEKTKSNDNVAEDKKKKEQDMLPGSKINQNVRVENWEELLLSYLINNDEILITGPTGCGKSSLVPPLIMRHFPESTVLLIQPRRMAATELAYYIRRQNHLKEEDVGIMMGFTSMWNAGNRLVVATAGSVINVLLGSTKPPFDWVILDEIHELSQDIEMCFALLQRAKEINLWNFKLICMSATVNPKLLERFHAAHFVLGSGVNSNYTITERISLYAIHEISYLNAPAVETNKWTRNNQPISNYSQRMRQSAAIAVKRGTNGYVMPRIPKDAKNNYYDDEGQDQENLMKEQHMKLEIDQKTQKDLLDAAYNETLSIIYARVYHDILAEYFENTKELPKNSYKKRKSTFRKAVENFIKKNTDDKFSEGKVDKYLKENNIQIFNSMVIGEIDINTLKPYLDDPKGDILIFLPGMAMLRRLRSMFEKATPKLHFAIHLLHSSISSETRMLAISTPVSEPNIGKIFISTNITETSLTIPGVTHVLDSCLSNKMIKVNNQVILKTISSSHNEMLQRRGRVGRTSNGVYTILTDLKNIEKLPQNGIHEIYEQGFSDYLTRISGSMTFGLPIFVMENTLSELNVKQLLESYILLKEIGGITPISSKKVKELTDKYRQDTVRGDRLVDKSPLFSMAPTSLMKIISQFGLDVGVTCMFGMFLGVPYSTIVMSRIEKGVTEFEKDPYVNRMMIAMTSHDAVYVHNGSLLDLRKRRRLVSKMKEFENVDASGWIGWMKNLAHDIDANKASFVKELETRKAINFFNTPIASATDDIQPQTIPEYFKTYDGLIPASGSKYTFIPTPIVHLPFNIPRAMNIWSYSIPLPTPYPSPIEKSLNSILALDSSKLRSINLEIISYRERLATYGLINGSTSAESFLKSYNIDTNVNDLSTYIVKGSHYNFSTEVEKSLIDEQRKNGCVLGLSREECIYGSDELRFRVGVANLLGSSVLMVATNERPCLDKESQKFTFRLRDLKDKSIVYDKDFKLVGSDDISENEDYYIAPINVHKGCCLLNISLHVLGYTEKQESKLRDMSKEIDICQLAITKKPSEFRKQVKLLSGNGNGTKTVQDVFSLICRLPYFVEKCNKIIRESDEVIGLTELTLDNSFKSSNIVIKNEYSDELFTYLYYVKHVLAYLEMLEDVILRVRRYVELSLGFQIQWCRILNFLKVSITIVIPFNKHYSASELSRGNLDKVISGEINEDEDKVGFELGIGLNENDFDTEVESSSDIEIDISDESLGREKTEETTGSKPKKSENDITEKFEEDTNNEDILYMKGYKNIGSEISSPLSRSFVLFPNGHNSFSRQIFEDRINKIFMNVEDADDDTKIEIIPYTGDYKLFQSIKGSFVVLNDLCNPKDTDIRTRKINLNPKTADVLINTNDIDMRKVPMGENALIFVSSYRMVDTFKASPGSYTIFTSGINTLPILWSFVKNMYSGLEVYYEFSEMEKILNARVAKKGQKGDSDKLDFTKYNPNQLFQLPNKFIPRDKMKGKIHLVIWNSLDTTNKCRYEPVKEGKIVKKDIYKEKYISIVTDESELERRYILGLVDRLSLIFRTIECILVDFSDIDIDLESDEGKQEGLKFPPTLSHDWRLADEEELPQSEDDLYYKPLEIYENVDKSLRIQGKRTKENLSDCLVRYIKELCYYSEKCPERLAYNHKVKSQVSILDNLFRGIGQSLIENRTKFEVPPTAMLPMRLLPCSPKIWRNDDRD